MEQNPQNALWYVNKKTTSIRQEVINLRLGMILAAQLPHDTFTSFMTSNTLRFIISDLCQFPYNVRQGFPTFSMESTVSFLYFYYFSELYLFVCTQHSDHSPYHPHMTCSSFQLGQDWHKLHYSGKFHRVQFANISSVPSPKDISSLHELGWQTPKCD